MILSVRVNPKSSKIDVIKEGTKLKVYLNKPAHDGEANAQLIEVLSDYLKVKKSQVTILKGERSRNKIVEING